MAGGDRYARGLEATVFEYIINRPTDSGQIEDDCRITAKRDKQFFDANGDAGIRRIQRQAFEMAAAVNRAPGPGDADDGDGGRVDRLTGIDADVVAGRQGRDIDQRQWPECRRIGRQQQLMGCDALVHQAAFCGQVGQR